MKLNITTENLRKALGRLSNVPGVVNTHLPTLAISIEASDFGAKLRRTTGTTSVTLELEAEVDAPGECAVSYDKLVDTVNAMGGKETVLDADPKHLIVRCGRSKGELNAYPAGETLPPPEVKPASYEIAFTTTELQRWFGITTPAAASDKEPKFAGVCLRVCAGRLVMFAVDRRRAHQVWLPVENPQPVNGTAKQDAGVLLVNETVAAMRKMLPELDARVDLKVCGGSLFVKCAELEALLPLGIDVPPDMAAFMPDAKPSDMRAVCNRAELLGYVRSAAPLGYQESRVISVLFKDDGFEGAVLEIVADNQSDAKLGHELDAEVIGGNRHLRAVGSYLAELIEAQSSEQITLNYTDKGMLYACEEDRICVLMLVRDGANQ